jgi:hypothetical protein
MNTKCMLCGQTYRYRNFEKHLLECPKFAHMKELSPKMLKRRN